MKKFLLISVCCVGLFYYGMGLEPNPVDENGRIIVDNDKLQVVEFIGSPGKSVCGLSMHEHKPHLSILLTDGAVKVTTPDKKSQEFDFKSGTTLWSGADIHEAVNIGDNEIRVLLVYLK